MSLNFSFFNCLQKKEGSISNIGSADMSQCCSCEVAKCNDKKKAKRSFLLNPGLHGNGSGAVQTRQSFRGKFSVIRWSSWSTMTMLISNSGRQTEESRLRMMNLDSRKICFFLIWFILQILVIFSLQQPSFPLDQGWTNVSHSATKGSNIFRRAGQMWSVYIRKRNNMESWWKRALILIEKKKILEFYF